MVIYLVMFFFIIFIEFPEKISNPTLIFKFERVGDRVLLSRKCLCETFSIQILRQYGRIIVKIVVVIVHKK